MTSMPPAGLSTNAAGDTCKEVEATRTIVGVGREESAGTDEDASAPMDARAVPQRITALPTMPGRFGARSRTSLHIFGISGIGSPCECIEYRFVPVITRGGGLPWQGECQPDLHKTV